MDELESIQEDLLSADLWTRVRACIRAGSVFEKCECALPVLRQFVIVATNHEAHDVNIAVRSLGRLVRHCGIRKGPGYLTIVNEYTDFLIDLLEKSEGVFSFSLIFALCFVGPSGKSNRAIDSVLSAIERSQNRKEMQYRGYQYACAVQRSLLDSLPWSGFVPATSDLKEEWDIDRILKNYDSEINFTLPRSSLDSSPEEEPSPDKSEE